MKVIIQPQNGYINRIQAIASSALLAREIGADFEVYWIPSAAAPAKPEDIFSLGLLECFAAEPVAWSLEPYLNYDSVSRVVTLAGLDRGEQAFMSELGILLESGVPIDEIRISAGGKFSLGGLGSNSVVDRSGFYRDELRFSSEIESAVESYLSGRGGFLGLHLRYSDRNHQAPTRSQVLKALAEVAQNTGVSRVFVATDSPNELPWWKSELEGLGLAPWCVDGAQVSRQNPRAALSALIDWRLLSKSDGVVYFSESSFGEEAAVASGNFNDSIAVKRSGGRAFWVRIQAYLFAGLTYPKRHFFAGKKEV